MSDVNAYAFTGRLGADAKLTYTNGGAAIWTARIAVDHGWGEKKSTNWLNAKALGRHAENLDKLALSKGARIGGSGALQIYDYPRPDGTQGTAVEVLLDNLTVLAKQGNQA